MTTILYQVFGVNVTDDTAVDTTLPNVVVNLSNDELTCRLNPCSAEFVLVSNRYWIRPVDAALHHIDKLILTGDVWAVVITFDVPLNVKNPPFEVENIGVEDISLVVTDVWSEVNVLG